MRRQHETTDTLTENPQFKQTRGRLRTVQHFRSFGGSPDEEFNTVWLFGGAYAIRGGALFSRQNGMNQQWFVENNLTFGDVSLATEWMSLFHLFVIFHSTATKTL